MFAGNRYTALFHDGGKAAYIPQLPMPHRADYQYRRRFAFALYSRRLTCHSAARGTYDARNTKETKIAGHGAATPER